MNQIISGILKSTHSLTVKKQLLERIRSAYLQIPCPTTTPIIDRTCYYLINYVRELTVSQVDVEILTFGRTCLQCCHNPECLCSIAEQLINDSRIDVSISFVQLLSDCLPSEIGRAFLERAIFERHELNNEALRFILLLITKNRQLTNGQRTIFYIKLVELVLSRLRTLDFSVEQVELFCKQLASTIEELCFENNKKSNNLLNDMVNGVTGGLLTCLADSSTKNEPSTALANIIDLLQECPNENLLDSFILTIDDDRLVLCLNRLARVFRWPSTTTKPSQWLVSIWKLLFKREREMLVAQSASSSIISDLISMIGNPSCYQNIVPALCWIFVNQPFHLQTFASPLQNEILQLVLNNPNFLSDNMEMNNLVESVRYGLKSLLNNEDNVLNQDLFNNLLQSLPKSNQSFAKNIHLMKCKSSSVENYSNEIPIRLHDKIGLANMGNTCYLNAMMQALYSCTQFRKCVLNCDALSTNNELLKSLQNLFAFLTASQRSYYRPERFWLQTKPSYFERNQQQDCQEFLRHLLDTLHEEAKRTIQNESTLDCVKQHLMGTCIHQSKCLTCLSITNSQDLFYDLSLGFNDQSLTTNDQQQKCFDLQSLIDHAFAWEPLVNENQFECDTCQTKQDGSRRMFLTSHPNYLILLLKRFVHNRLTGKYEKCLDRTTLPELIQLLTVNEAHISYRLKAIVVHHGLSMNSGHYYAFVMCNNDDLVDKNNANHIGWWLFNDTHVEHLSFENVCAHFQRFQSATPYVLIFEKDTQDMNATELPMLPYLQTLVEHDNQLYAQEQTRRSRSSKSADMSDVSEPYYKNTGCKDQSPDRGPPCIF
ncbi:unnamed protein product [Rotaria socialis]|uniref:Ubiquitin carboxyl-terminal hydrolase n=2 Tax=Rotaria socialis TaxID=392032 RepID=A0A818LLF4_9BILA|nr:unnamed protein product [Rotaria socialis]CAF3461733.1 unnamed protein product [Rotaria socialis]CAF3466812.1 unnamed protein product [Rotaria socialis]CAF3580046.1 unnamed protein product [Rotaria socialis]CAF3786932.1 unnamed protein product [Rotaria socialis]